MQDLSPHSRLDRFRRSWFRLVLRAVLGAGFLYFAVEAFAIDDPVWGVISATFGVYVAFTAVAERRRPRAGLFAPVFLLVGAALITAGVLALREGTAALAALLFAGGGATCVTVIVFVIPLYIVGRRKKRSRVANGR